MPSFAKWAPEPIGSEHDNAHEDCREKNDDLARVKRKERRNGNDIGVSPGIRHEQYGDGNRQQQCDGGWFSGASGFEAEALAEKREALPCERVKPRHAAVRERIAKQMA